MLRSPSRGSGVRPTWLSAALLASVWAAAVAWAWLWLDRGWVPHDAGALGQSAERILAGQVPHVDFDEIYTGALSWLHAAAFRLFGIRLMSMRWVLLAAFVAWVPAVWWIVRRFVGPVTAAAATLLAAVLSIPNYSESLPSWYLLFLATWAAAAMLRFEETARLRWVALAGAAAGGAVLMKINGIYLLAALGVWLLALDQDARPGTGRDEAAGGRVGAGALSAGAALVVIALMRLVDGFAAPVRAAYLVLPVAAVLGLLVAREWRGPGEPVAARARRLGRPLAALAAGVALPVLVFLGRYLGADALGALHQGVWVAPRTRLDFAAMEPPRAWTAVWTLAPVALVGLGVRGRLDSGRTLLLLGVLLALVWLTTGHPPVYRAVWGSLRWSIPVLGVGGAWVLWRRRGGQADHAGGGSPPLAGRSHGPRGASMTGSAFGLLSVAAFMALVQFPFAAPVYFLYVAPLAVLAATALLGPRPAAHRPWAVALAFYAGFVALRVTPGFIHAMPYGASREVHTERLDLERGGIRVTPRDRALYTGLVRAVRARAAGGPVWAGPDAPEVPFLAGAPNPTRRVFDFLAGDAGAEAAAFFERLEAAGVRAVVLNAEPDFSEPPGPAWLRAAAERYPRAQTFGRFTLRWR